MFAWVLEFATGDGIDWHIDRNSHPEFKLSCSVPLSAAADFTGGQLQCRVDDRHNYFPVGRGQVLVFPSWTLHRVSEITTGCRYSLVTWAAGPPFR